MAGLIYYKGFILCGSKNENDILKKAVDYCPKAQFSNRGRYYRKIAIYTSTPRYGIVLDRTIRKKCNIILLQSNNFPTSDDPMDPVFRFLVFTLLHEYAHIRGVKEDFDAHEQAMQWHNAYVTNNKIKALPFSWKEKDLSEDIILKRQWIYVSTITDSSDFIAGLAGKPLVDSFLQKCQVEGKGPSTILKSLLRQYIES